MLEIEWLEKFKQKASEIKKVKSLVYYYGKIDMWQINKEYDLCDFFLKSIEVENLSLTLLIGIPRLMFRSKYRMKEYNSFLEKVRQELINRGENQERLLRGLDI